MKKRHFFRRCEDTAIVENGDYIDLVMCKKILGHKSVHVSEYRGKKVKWRNA